MTRKDLTFDPPDNRPDFVRADGEFVDAHLDLRSGHLTLRRGLTLKEQSELIGQAIDIIETPQSRRHQLSA